MVAEHTVVSDPARRLRATNSLLIAVILILLGQVTWQYFRINALKTELRQSQVTLAGSVERLAADRIRSLGREELTATVTWLDEVYRSADGLQRPTGLWRDDIKRPDSEALAVWILDVYLQARISGKSDAEARELVMTQIKSTEEWRRKHPTT